jgi:4-hydroxy-tetrahydrodipicolinate synthase
LSSKEKTDLIRALKKAVSVPLIANAGRNDTRASIRNAREAEELAPTGCFWWLLTTTSRTKECSTINFAAIASSVGIPSMLYNVPSRTGITIKSETIVKLSKGVPSINMLKDAAGNLDETTAVIRDAAPGFKVYTGEDALTLPSLAIGAYGVVSVAGHVVAPMMKRMMESYLSGDVAAAAVLHARLLAVNKALFIQPNPVPVKEALRLCGFDAGPLRPPLKTASADTAAALSRALSELGLIK